MNTPSVQQMQYETYQAKPTPSEYANSEPEKPDAQFESPVQSHTETQPPQESHDTTTLEEYIVGIRAPVGKSEPIQFMDTSFHPVASNLVGASMYE
jgi:hypothetical protein